MVELVVAAIQMACSSNVSSNLDRLEGLVRSAAARGAGLVVLQELFEDVYFCKDRNPRHLSKATPVVGHPTIMRFSSLARELGVVLPVSFYERDGERYFNSLVMIDADGSISPTYRKSHIPDNPGYWEKTFFADGDSGFLVHETAVGRIGAGICWDQWFPEAARAMVLMGAEILIYPTAIGSEPSYPGWDSRDHWQRVMQGHAGANLVPVIAANRTGVEKGEDCEVIFYGSSFIADHTGAKIAEADRLSESIITAAIDLDDIAETRRNWNVFRDRRPELYSILQQPSPEWLKPR